jgi:hypothetical protein
MSLCTMATRLPRVIVSSERIARAVVQGMLVASKTLSRMRIRIAKPAALDAIDMNAVTGVGAPS